MSGKKNLQQAAVTVQEAVKKLFGANAIATIRLNVYASDRGMKHIGGRFEDRDLVEQTLEENLIAYEVKCDSEFEDQVDCDVPGFSRFTINCDVKEKRKKLLEEKARIEKQLAELETAACYMVEDVDFSGGDQDESSSFI